MTDLRYAAQKAIEVMQTNAYAVVDVAPHRDVMEYYKAIAALAGALEQPEQEPVAWEQIGLPSGRTTAAKGWLFSEPSRRELRGLKEWEINDGLDQIPSEDVCSWSFRKGVYFAEKALKEKNT